MSKTRSTRRGSDLTRRTQLVILGPSGSGKTTLFDYLTKSDVLRTAENVAKVTARKNKSAPVFDNSYSTEGATGLRKYYLKDNTRKRIFRKLISGTLYLAQKKNDKNNSEYINILIEAETHLLDTEFEISKEVASALIKLWEQDTIKDLFEEEQFTVQFIPFEQLNYFQNRLVNYPLYCGPGWYPDIEDLIRCSSPLKKKSSRKKTLKNFDIEITDASGVKDVNGLFEGIIKTRPYDRICVVFVVSLGDFDMTIDESDTNSLYNAYAKYKEFQINIMARYRHNIKGVIVYFNKLHKFNNKYKHSGLLLDLSVTNINFPYRTEGINWKQAATLVSDLFYNAAINENIVFSVAGSVFHSNSMDTLANLITECLSPQKRI